MSQTDPFIVQMTALFQRCGFQNISMQLVDAPETFYILMSDMVDRLYDEDGSAAVEQMRIESKYYQIVTNQGTFNIFIHPAFSILDLSGTGISTSEYESEEYFLSMFLDCLIVKFPENDKQLSEEFVHLLGLLEMNREA